MGHLALLKFGLLIGCAAAAGIHVVTDSSGPNLTPVSFKPLYVTTLGRGGASSSDTAQHAGMSSSIPIIHMTDARGVRNACQVSGLPAAAAPSDLDGLKTEVQTPWQLLESLASMCLYRQEGQWTYEVCYKKHVRQFRPEGAGKAEEHSCGKYTGDTPPALSPTAQANAAASKYISHRFSGGGTCVMTGEARTAEVRFTCLHNVADNVITSVKEFPTCNYIIIVGTPLLCKHPDYMLLPEDYQVIACEPLQDQGAAVAHEAKGAERTVAQR